MNTQLDSPDNEIALCGYCAKRYPEEHANCNDGLCECPACAESDDAIRNYLDSD